MFLNSLSGRFLLLTVVFVMLAEVLIFVPSVARFRESYLQSRLERAQIASLAVLANKNEMIDPALERELLQNAGVLNVVLHRDSARELVLSSPMTQLVSKSFDMRKSSAFGLIRDAMLRLFDPTNRVIRAVGMPVNMAGLEIEVTLHTNRMRQEMLDYGGRVFLLSAVISVITAALLFFAVRRFLVAPISRVISQIKAYKDAPQNPKLIIRPSAGITELHEAEEAIRLMQIELSGALKQKDRLATLGGAVAKISHDLRNMLTTAQLLTDRMDMSHDPAVKRTTPKLVNSLTRAVNLCESTLTFGKAEEPAPEIAEFQLRQLVQDVVESEELTTTDGKVRFEIDIPAQMSVAGDPEQVFRILLNLVRNARQAITASQESGEIIVSAEKVEATWCVFVRDTGPGLPAKAREKLFKPFEGGTRKGGSGLGLAIAWELVRGHGGKLELVESSSRGTCFRVVIPYEPGP